MKTEKAISKVLIIFLVLVIVVIGFGFSLFFMGGIIKKQVEETQETLKKQTAGFIRIENVFCVPGSRIEILAINEGMVTIPENQIRVFINGKITVRNITAEDKITTLTNQNIQSGQRFWILVTDLDAETPGIQKSQAGQIYKGQIVSVNKTWSFQVIC